MKLTIRHHCPTDYFPGEQVDRIFERHRRLGSTNNKLMLAKLLQPARFKYSWRPKDVDYAVEINIL